MQGKEWRKASSSYLLHHHHKLHARLRHSFAAAPFAKRRNAGSAHRHSRLAMNDPLQAVVLCDVRDHASSSRDCFKPILLPQSRRIRTVCFRSPTPRCSTARSSFSPKTTRKKYLYCARKTTSRKSKSTWGRSRIEGTPDDAKIRLLQGLANMDTVRDALRFVEEERVINHDFILCTADIVSNVDLSGAI